MYQVRLTNQAKKDLKRLAKVYFSKVSRILDNLATNPFLGGKMADEFKGHYRIKIPPLRIIYEADFKNKIIWVKAIRHRQGVYS